MARGYATVGQAHSHLGCGDVVYTDLSEVGAGYRMVTEVRPSVVVNCAALTNVDLCENEPRLAQRLNADLCGELAIACNDIGASLVSISTDQLWRNSPPFAREDLPPDPVGVYGVTKADGEIQSRQARSHIIFRTNFFGRGHSWRPSLSDLVLTRLRGGHGFTGFSDVYFTPLAVGIAVDWVIDAVEANLTGTFHLGGGDRVSKYEFAVALAKAAGLDAGSVRSGRIADAKLVAARPTEMSLSSDKIAQALGRAIPNLYRSLHNALA